MFMAWLRSMLGPFTVVLDYFSENPGRLSIILVAWASIYFLGLLQLKRIESKTIALVLQESAAHLKQRPDLSSADLYQAIYPLWRLEFTEWKYWFIPHKHDMWPVRVTLDNVLAKIPISPEWIESVLAKNGINLS